MKKFFLFLSIGIVALLAFLFVFKDAIARQILDFAVTRLTGFQTEIKQLHLDLAQGVLQVRDLTIYNPNKFEKKVFADFPEIYIAVDLPALLKHQRVHLPEVRLSIQELNIEKNRHGISNIQLLSGVGEKGGNETLVPNREKTQIQKQDHPSENGTPFLLDRLELTAHKVSYADYSGLIEKKISVDMKIEKEVFEKIQDPKSIIYLI